jgi:hypothetical protein
MPKIYLTEKIYIKVATFFTTNIVSIKRRKLNGLPSESGYDSKIIIKKFDFI